MVIIHFVDAEDNQTKQYGSRPLTIGIEKALARYERDTVIIGLEAAALQGFDKETAASELLAKCDEVYMKLEELVDTRTAIILRAFNNQFTLDEFEDGVTSAEAIRVIAALQEETKGIIAKNV